MLNYSITRTYMLTMFIEKADQQNLTIAERKSVLLFDNETLPADIEEKLEAIDLSNLKDKQFDKIVDQIIGYRKKQYMRSAPPRMQTKLNEKRTTSNWL